MKRVAIQGYEGCFHEEAARQFYPDIRFQSYERYMQALSAVRPLISDLDVLGEYTAGQN